MWPKLVKTDKSSVQSARHECGKNSMQRKIINIELNYFTTASFSRKFAKSEMEPILNDLAPKSEPFI